MSVIAGGPEAIACRLCGGATRPLFERQVLGHIEVAYYQCAECGLTQTQEPTWLDEAYSDAIAASDTGVLARNLAAQRVVGTFLHLEGVRDESCLDYAGGYGLLTRLMRDLGFNFYWTDPYAQNLVARGFEWSDALGTPRAVTAFEVLEHWARPLDEFRKLATLGADWIITSTELHPGERPTSDWHYLSTESGQHVAFYRRDTLERLGRETGYPHLIAGSTIQVFARRPLTAWHWSIATQFTRYAFPFVRRAHTPLTDADCERLRRQSRA